MLAYGDICGGTPLVKISDRLYGKLETYNPTGSVKDRMISFVVSHALNTGKIKNNTVICEATSGNTGIALSAQAAAMGLRCIIFMPENMSEERKQMMKVFGAELIDAPPDDFATAIQMRDNFLASVDNSWSPMQFSNPINIECHRQVTAPEIYAQVNELGLEWSAFVHGSGTGGTIEGVRRFCIDKNLKTRIVMTIPSTVPHGIQGIGDGKDFLANPSDMHDTIHIDTASAVFRSKQFAKETGLLVGISSGANILAAEEYLNKQDISGIIVTMLCDRGERYMTIY